MEGGGGARCVESADTHGRISKRVRDYKMLFESTKNETTQIRPLEIRLDAAIGTAQLMEDCNAPPPPPLSPAPEDQMSVSLLDFFAPATKQSGEPCDASAE